MRLVEGAVDDIDVHVGEAALAKVDQIELEAPQRAEQRVRRGCACLDADEHKDT